MASDRQLRGHSGPVVNQVVKLGENEITLGRDLANDVVIADGEVSRIHARLSWRGESHEVRDLKSTNGTWINGRPIFGAARLALGDLLTLGKTSVFAYELVPVSELDTTREDESGSDQDLATSTMAMPMAADIAPDARRVIGAVPARPVVGSPAAEQGVPAETPARAFQRKYLACLQSGDFEGLLSLYDTEATLLSAERCARGAAGVREFFLQYFGGPGAMKTRATGKCVESLDAVQFESIVETAESVARVLDAFVLRDGKASHHFTWILQVTPKLAR